MGAAVDLYTQMRTIVDDMAQVIGQFDPHTADRTTRAILHASLAPQVIVTLALLNKVLPGGIPVLTLADLTAARDAAYSDNWPAVVEPPVT